jgi:hypothetical protein
LDVGWYRVTANGTLAVGNDAAMGGNALLWTPGTTFRSIVGVMPSTVSLVNIGDYIELSFRYRFTTAPSNQVSGLRFGLYNDNGSVTTADELTETNQDSLQYGHSSKNDFGYYANLSTGTTTSAELYRESGNTSSIVNGGDRGLLNPTGGSPAGLSGTDVHTAYMRITRSAAGVDIVAGIDGVDFIQGTSTTAYTQFNEIAFGNGGNNIPLVFDDVRVDFVPVPEPSTFVLLALMALAAVCYRRR